MRSSFMQMASPRPPMPPVTNATRCAICSSVVLLETFLRVLSRGGLDRLPASAAQLLPPRHELAAVPPQPLRPYGPPASRRLPRRHEPFFGIGTQLVVPPLTALVLRGRVDPAPD